MKFRPILFSTEMVQAILAGRKTQTRRIIKPQPTQIGGLWRLDKKQASNRPFNEWHNHPFGIHSPYGQVGDVLWVRETFYKSLIDDSYQYKADRNYSHGISWKPSLFMPKAAARIFLRITNIRVERLQDISEEDAKAEGIKSYFSTVFKEEMYKDYQDKSSFLAFCNPLI